MCWWDIGVPYVELVRSVSGFGAAARKAGPGERSDSDNRSASQANPSEPSTDSIVSNRAFPSSSFFAHRSRRIR
ncbi:hypothetical protein N136_04597 [Leifsonia aquatica ATCC 14665]|uniref:Uncharacterized protein n=1 Tax=Leifsonia aquatica ATCC 14665 TaxID=1358026 RepID=U2T056_LEIAQ|nr:hypothetical protein N136_04597 [Leifsonia aquatica ATCC 14665]